MSKSRERLRCKQQRVLPWMLKEHKGHQVRIGPAQALLRMPGANAYALRIRVVPAESCCSLLLLI